jgi:drug/metabolite transporter (DMT)-like permease
VRPRDVVELFVLAAIWGGSYLFMRVAAPVLGPVPVSAARVAIAALLLVPLLALRGGAGELRQRAGAIAVVGAINSALPFALIAYATLSLTAGFASILNATSPLWGGLVAHLWLRERLTRVRVVGLVVGFTGVVVLVSGKASFPAGAGLALVASLVAPLSYGVAASYTKRHLGGSSPLAVAAGSQVAATLMLLPFAAASSPRAPASPTVWLSVLALGVACTGIAYTMYFRLIQNVGPSRAIAVTFLVPAFATAWGWLFLGEAVTGRMIVGGLVILAGTALATGLVAPRSAAAGPRARGGAAEAR